MSVDTPPAPTMESEDAAAPSPADQGWRLHKNGRWFSPARGKPGFVYRQGTETIEEAHARAAKSSKDTPPKGRAAPKVPKAPAPTQVTLKELEFMLIEALSAPSMVAAMQGDEWAANHFTSSAIPLARNLTKAAEHNPWLRSKLEAVMAGDVLLIRVMTLFPVAAALIAYAVPPVIYYLDPPFIPGEAREMFRVPKRERGKSDQEEETGAPSPAGAERAETPLAA